MKSTFKQFREFINEYGDRYGDEANDAIVCVSGRPAGGLSCSYDMDFEKLTGERRISRVEIMPEAAREADDD